MSILLLCQQDQRYQAHSAFLTAAQALPGAAFPVAVFSSPDGATKRLSGEGVDSSSIGVYDSRVTQFGAVTYARPQRGEADLVGLDLTVQIVDRDKWFHKLVYAYRKTMRGSAWTMKMAVPGVAEADWPVTFTGIVDRWRQVGINEWSIGLTPPQIPLKSPWPRTVLGTGDVPNAGEGVVGQMAPVLYGQFDALPYGGGGAVPLLLVDKVAYKYLLCAGRAYSVDRVYADGTFCDASAYEVTYPVMNGKQFTVVTFDADQGSKRITVDCQGYERKGDGTGVLILNPAEQLAHLLDNFIYGDYRSGDWLKYQAPLSWPHFADVEDFCNRHGHKGSRYLSGERTRGESTLKDWLTSLQASATWTRYGTLMIGVNQMFPTQRYRDYPWFRWDRDPVAPGGLVDYESFNGADRISLDYCQLPEGGFQNAIEVRDRSIPNVEPTALSLNWSPAV